VNELKADLFFVAAEGRHDGHLVVGELTEIIKDNFKVKKL